MTADAVREDREKSSFILVAALVLSLVAHVALMLSLENCAFDTITDVVRHARKWTRDSPLTRIVRHTGDPMAEAITPVRPVIAPAPVVESMPDRVARLAEEPSTRVPSLPTVAAPTLPIAPPSNTKPAMWQVQEEINILDHPIEHETTLIRPKAIKPKDEQWSGVPTLPPARPLDEVPVMTKLPTEDMTLMLPTQGLAGTNAAPGIGNSNAFTFESTVVSDNTAVAPPVVEDKPPAIHAAVPVQEPPRPVLAEVNEQIVQEEKKAVRILRDVPQAQLLAQHVACSLDYWIDPAQTSYKYFRLRISPEVEDPLDVVPKDVVYLLDASGSIGTDRLKSCRRAVLEAIANLNGNDRFNIVAFRDRFAYLFKDWHDVDKKSLTAAEDWVSNLFAHGRTDVFATLRSVLTVPRSPARPLIAFVVTDGEATSGLTRSTAILSAFNELNDGLVAVYMYGVKEKANAYLLDLIARENRGNWSRHEGMRWRAASGIPDLTAQFADPVLTDVTVTFAASSDAEVYPKRPPHLCRKSVIDLYGRCPAFTRELAFSIRGLNGRQACADVFKIPFKRTPTLDETVRQDWAQRCLYARVGEYARHPSNARLNELKQFSRRYHVAIPYEAQLEKK